ncbi:hypothetical protein LUZ60_003600 [Juncus effusus]|nr:hypothetical protein LUZ60_003600 [Juncus effusus]
MLRGIEYAHRYKSFRARYWVISGPSFALLSTASHLGESAALVSLYQVRLYYLCFFTHLTIPLSIGVFSNDVKPQDFFFSGLDKAGDTSGKLRSSLNLVNVQKLAGLNTLGISIARLDFAPYGGLNPPHIHPRATEVLTVLEGLIHFQFNIGPVPAVASVGLGSQNPGVITVANAVFGSSPSISDDVLAKAFQLDKKTVDWLQAQFST